MKVYVVMDYDHRSNMIKVNSVFRKEESAHEAMLDLASYDVGDGSTYFSKMEDKNRVNVYYVPDLYDNDDVCGYIAKTYYVVTKELI